MLSKASIQHWTILSAAVLALSACGTSAATSAALPAETTSSAVDTTAAPTTALETEIPDGCPALDGSSERTVAFAAPPPMCIDPAGKYTATVQTNRGPFVMELDAAKAPQTVNNFVTLARFHFYDGVAFHRIIPGFVIQGGDAVGQPAGTGNPGYRFADELPVAGDYQIGSVAMANSGPNTNGSQFFIVTGENGASLPPLYSLFATVTSGLDVIGAIEQTGTQTGAPTEPTIIESVAITEG